jgi:hypothetical protein
VADATCKTCPFWDATPADRAGEVGARECHVRSPAAFTVRCGGLPGEEPSGRERDARWPWTEPDNWCGEHPLRQRDRLAAMAMQAAIPATLVTVAQGEPDALVRLAIQSYAVADVMIARGGRHG